MSKKILYTVSIIAIIDCFIFLPSCKKKEGIVPTIGAITESVYASGFVKAEEQYNVVSSVPGTLSKIYVKVGDSVRKGDPVFAIKNTVSEFAIENSQLALRRAEENRKKIPEMVRQLELLELKYKQDSVMFARQGKLWDQGVGTKVQVEQAELVFKGTKTEYLNLTTQLSQLNTALKLDQEMASNNVRIAKENAEGFVVRSAVDGRVFTIFPKEGEGISPQTVMAIIGKQDRFLIEIQVDENDIARIQEGQEVFVTMDSYKDSVYKAIVSMIYPIMNEKTGTFTVEGTFTKAPPRIYPHLNLEANIFLGRRTNAMIIPREYLIDETYVLTEGEKKIKVNVGLKNFEFAEILGGLNKTQKIVKP